MAKVRRVLGACSIETARRRRLCHRNRRKHSIPMGTSCLVIKDPVSGGSKNYCPECAMEILDMAADDLEELRQAFA